MQVIKVSRIMLLKLYLPLGSLLGLMGIVDPQLLKTHFCGLYLILCYAGSTHTCTFESPVFLRL